MVNDYLSGPINALLNKELTLARELKGNKQYAEAAQKYRLCAKLQEQYAGRALSDSVKKQRLDKAKKYLEIAAQLEEDPEALVKNPKTSIKKRPAVPGSKISDDETEDDPALIVNQFIDRSKITWQDIGGLNDTKKKLKKAYGFGVAKSPDVELPKQDRFCLYGPPGTGKTLLAAACSSGLEATFYNVKPDLLSKYFGESEKRVSYLFEHARVHAPSLIFVDDFEALMLSRDQDTSGVEQRVLRQFLGELDGFLTKKSDSLVMFIGATNKPWLLDEASMSRFSGGFIYVPLPDDQAREQILKIHIEAKRYRIYCSYKELVEMTKGYSGRELKNISESAQQAMLERANPGFISVIDQGLEAIKQYNLKIDTISESDILSALTDVRPTTDTTAQQRYASWESNRSSG